VRVMLVSMIVVVVMLPNVGVDGRNSFGDHDG
jgi:hypothetical protein